MFAKRKINLELVILIEASKIALLGNSSNNLQKILSNNKINWKQLQKLVSFHSIRPILNHALSVCDSNTEVPLGFTDTLKNACISQSFYNMAFKVEIPNLLRLLEANGIAAMPFKGIVFTHSFYPKENLREAGDLDILIHKKDIKKALKVLIDNAYNYKVIVLNQQSENHNFITNISSYSEISLRKTMWNSANVNLDLHWALHYEHLPLKTPIDLFFNSLKKEKFYDNECKMPSIETIFWTMLVHHGGKESWLKIKNLCDLLMFYKKFGHEIDWKEILRKSENIKIKRNLLFGFYYLEKYFEIQIPPIIKCQFAEHKIGLNDGIHLWFWQKGEHWESPKIRIVFEYIFKLHQDADFDFLKYAKETLITFAKPNPLERKRLITFPDKFKFLNLVSKIITYLTRPILGSFFPYIR